MLLLLLLLLVEEEEDDDDDDDIVILNDGQKSHFYIRSFISFARQHTDTDKSRQSGLAGGDGGSFLPCASHLHCIIKGDLF